MMPPVLPSTTSNSLLRSAKQPCLIKPARAKNTSESASGSTPSVASGPSALSRTTLSQRFRRAVQQGDLSAAQRISARAFELQFLPHPAAIHDDDAGGGEQSSPNCPPRLPKAALRAAQAQRPSSAHPFDVRNVEPIPERIGPSRHHHQRKYTLAIHDEPVAAADTATSADPSLLIAIKNNADVELIRWLIEMGHEHNAPSVDADGNTVLHLATLYDRSDIIYAYSTYTTSHVASTLADLIDAETLHERRTALHLACIRGYDDVTRQLLDLGADVDLQDRAGNTALHFASAWGHLSLVQLLIERGCSLAVKNADDSTASDYAYSHSVKEALETMGRARYESRKKTRRVPVATVMPAAIRPSVSTAFSQGDESTVSDRQSRSRPFPSFLSRNGSLGGASRSNSNTTPVRNTFHDTSASENTPELYDDWDPEKTFAQPGQDLFPSNRGAFSSPPVQRVASPAQHATPSRTSIDLYAEVLNLSPRAPPPLVRRTPSPGNIAASADKVRMQDAAAMSLFRTSTPQPGSGHVPGRIETPPIPYGFRSESPMTLSVRSNRSGVKSPPVPLVVPSGRRSTSDSATSDGGVRSEHGNASAGERSSGGPPLLAPVATLPQNSQLFGGNHDTSIDKGGKADSVDERFGRSVYDEVQAAGGRRDSSPSTPRPADDRETFA
ncbi:hypothetical protein EX895_001162 [Sporisorium graminicola]|uniref:Uncharacterized protein n=1 Tax=Sporisorium graminicola TaxID=280036 RepID=A0A4U7KYC0_9BASI|nr:hypothetical protein EX895_001162 [Sporisorium graminicola]TKY89865.1 hypothetical protein EX895_001162 [Sporisorium graminicola]